MYTLLFPIPKVKLLIKNNLSTCTKNKKLKSKQEK